MDDHSLHQSKIIAEKSKYVDYIYKHMLFQSPVDWSQSKAL